jgi:GNAT superfamily N-acetyltransferase
VVQLTIRDVRKDDESAVLEIYKATPELHRNTPIDFLDDEERELAFATPNKIFLIAEEDGKVVGFAYVKIKHRTLHEEKARLLHLVVAPEKRGSGLASQLLNECKNRLVNLGITLFYSNVNSANRVMRKVLERNGFALRDVYLRFEVGLIPNQGKPFDFDWGEEGLD